MPAPETDLTLAPSYLTGRVALPDAAGPAALLMAGAWCGHGEPRYRVWDIPSPGDAGWRVATPLPPDDDPDEEDPDLMQFGASVVRLHAGAAQLDAYDARRHPANALFGTDEIAEALAVECDCGGSQFDVAVGFEVPSDSTSVDDTSWFAIAVRCRHCREHALVFDDETA